MRDKDKTKEQLIDELKKYRKRNAELEKSELKIRGKENGKRNEENWN